MNIFGFGTDLVNINRIRSIMIKSKNFKKKYSLHLKLEFVKKERTNMIALQKDLLLRKHFQKL